YFGLVRRVCERYAGGPDKARELISRVFINAARESDSRDHGPRTWLYFVSLHACLDLLLARRARGSLRVEDLDAPWLRLLVKRGKGDLAARMLENILIQRDSGRRWLLFLSLVEGLPPGVVARATKTSREEVVREINKFL